MSNHLKLFIYYLTGIFIELQLVGYSFFNNFGLNFFIMKKFFTILFLLAIGISDTDAATFTSSASGDWSTSSTWTRVGADSDGIPDQDDDVTIKNGHTIKLVVLQNYFKTLVIASGGTLNVNGQALGAYGNLTNNGTITGSFYYLRFLAASILTSSTPITNSGTWYIYSSLTISAGTVVNKNGYIYPSGNGALINNLGSVTINAGSLSFSGTTATWINGVNSFLQLSAAVAGTGILNCSATGNTVVCYTGCMAVPPTTYYNLTLSAATTTTKTTVGNITVLNNLTIGANVIQDLVNRNLTVGGNWINSSGKTILNQGIITFNGSGNQTISRTSTNEVFKNLVISSTGSVTLNRNIDVTTSLTLNSGTFDFSASNYTLNLAGNLINNGTVTLAKRGLFNFNGTTAQTVSGPASLHFYNVRSANSNVSGVSVTSDIFVDNVITVASGKFGTSGSGVITIPATAAATYGRIGTVGATGSLTGTGWKIESYINGPAAKGWQWLSSSTKASTLADWDTDYRFWMSGVNGNDGNALNTNGSGYFYSVRNYDEATGAYTNIISTATPLTPGKGFHIWMSDDLDNGLTAPLIYNSIGTPNFGNVLYPVTSGGAGSGYNLVGNPYACPITYSTVVAASGNLYSSFVILLENNTYSSDPNGGVIAPNQGFMCVASSGGNIRFTEAAKNFVTNPNILKIAQKPNAIAINVYNNVNGLGGQTNLEFSKTAADLFERETDLPFLTSPSEEADNIWTKSSDEKALLKNVLLSTNEDKQVPLIVKSGVYGKHHISVKGLSSVTDYNSVWLEDKSNGKTIDLLNGQEYDFDADEIGKEYEFTIHFSNNKKTGSIKENIQSNLLNENTSVYNTSSSVVVKFDMAEPTPVKISVYSLTGQQVIEPLDMNVTNDRISLPLQKENGMYLLLIQSKDQQVTRKIIY